MSQRQIRAVIVRFGQSFEAPHWRLLTSLSWDSRAVAAACSNRQGRAFHRASRTGATAGGSGAGCHVGGKDVIGVAIEILACPVIAHRGARIGVARGDLDVL